MPFVAIALDRKAPLHPLDHQIDAIPMIGGVSNTDLRTHVEPFADYDAKNISLELGIEFLAGCFGDETARVKHVTQQVMAHACGTQHIKGGSVKQPQLILGPARGDVEALARGIVRHRPNACGTRSGHHAEENDLALIALKRVGVTAY